MNSARIINMKFFLLLLIFLGFSALSTPDKLTGVKRFVFDELEQFNVKIVNYENEKYFTVADTTYEQNRNQYFTDLILSFNRKAAFLNRDDTRRYRVNYANYNLVNSEKVIGSGAAFFYKDDHFVSIDNQDKMWLSNTEDLGSFSIELKVCPLLIKSKSVLFSRVGFLGGEKNGIEMTLEDGILKSHFFSLFKAGDGEKKSTTLVSGIKLQEKKWYHYTVSYNRISGKLSHYIDDEEQSVKYMSDSGKPYNGVWMPAFDNDMPPIIIGKSYYGYLDEFRINFRSYGNLKKINDLSLTKYRGVSLKSDEPVNKEGVVSSPVYTFPLYGTMITSFSWKEKLEKDTFIWMEFRISDSKFDESDNHIKWFRIKNNQKNIYLKRVGDELLRGKYYQWRAHLVVSPDGKKSPKLRDVSMDYQLDPSPAVPLFLEPVGGGDEFVVIKWKKNVDHDFHGYKIYYGVRPGVYEGVLLMENNKILSNDHNKGDFIEIKIDNELIKQNKKFNYRGMLKYPVIKNNVLYYFAVSAYDSYKPGTDFNHESDITPEISVRPFAGSEIE